MRRLQCKCTMEKDKKHKGLEVDLCSNDIILGTLFPPKARAHGALAKSTAILEQIHYNL